MRFLKTTLLTVLVILWINCGGGSLDGKPPRTLVSIAIQPSIAEASAPSGTLPFAATASFDQPPTDQEIVSSQWSSSDTTIATIDSQGSATCVSAGGPVVITAVWGGKQATAQLSCVSSIPAAQGNCAYQCASVRCGALTGFCSVSANSACHQVYDPAHCPVGKPALGTMTDSCGIGVDTTRTCGP